jgi:hypothetical protein
MSCPGAKLHAYGHLRLQSLLAAMRVPSCFPPAPCLLQFSWLARISTCYFWAFWGCIPHPAHLKHISKKTTDATLAHVFSSCVLLRGVLTGAKLHAYGHLWLRSLLAATRLLQFSWLGEDFRFPTQLHLLQSHPTSLPVRCPKQQLLTRRGACVLLCSAKHQPASFLPGAKLHAYDHLRLRSLLAATRLPIRFQPAPCLLKFSWLGEDFSFSTQLHLLQLHPLPSRLPPPQTAAADKAWHT